MATVHVTKDNIESLINDNDTVVLDFWASWCGPCLRFAPVFEAASESEARAGIVFGKIDTEEQRELAAHFQIRSIPTLMVFREKVLLFSQPGALPPAAFDDLLDQIGALDMDDVRRQIAEEQSAEA